MKQLIPWLTSAITLWGIHEQGKKRWRGWAIGLGNQVLWIAFIVAFGAWGLFPLSLALIVMYTKNLLAWRRDEKLGMVGRYHRMLEKHPGLRGLDVFTDDDDFDATVDQLWLGAKRWDRFRWRRLWPRPGDPMPSKEMTK